MARYYWTRLVLGIIAASTALACSAILDTNSLNSQTPDGTTTEDANVDQEPTPDFLPGDLGSCVAGKPCGVAGQKGLCAVGESVCFDAGTGICKQTFTATAETCNGKDEDCDGVGDSNDSDAHTKCGSGKYCKGSVCAEGCWADSQCKGSTNKCTDHVCKCGTGSACTQPNPVCAADTCVCDSNSTCKANETCKSGVCYCGSTAGPSSGPACPSGNCNPSTGKCGTTPPPDVGPDTTVDSGPSPDTTVDL